MTAAEPKIFTGNWAEPKIFTEPNIFTGN